jgi:hypothetical protein
VVRQSNPSPGFARMARRLAWICRRMQLSQAYGQIAQQAPAKATHRSIVATIH